MEVMGRAEVLEQVKYKRDVFGGLLQWYLLKHNVVKQHHKQIVQTLSRTSRHVKLNDVLDPSNSCNVQPVEYQLKK